MDGFMLVDKEKGMTSHDVVAIARKKLKIDKIGHTGTLDPFASGLLILCISKATKLSYLFTESDKTYVGKIVFGKNYDTYDVTGKVTNEKEININENEIDEACNKFVGTYLQIPPIYSAIKIKGEKAYDIARRGETVEIKPREVSIFELMRTSPLLNNEFSFLTRVSKGTYIRSLAVDLGAYLNGFAALSELRRTSIGKYNINDAVSIDNISMNSIRSVAEIFKNHNRLVLDDYLIKLVKNGIRLDSRQIITDEPFVVVDKQNNLVAYYEVLEKNLYKSVFIF